MAPSQDMACNLLVTYGIVHSYLSLFHPWTPTTGNVTTQSQQLLSKQQPRVREAAGTSVNRDTNESTDPAASPMADQACGGSACEWRVRSDSSAACAHTQGDPVVSARHAECTALTATLGYMLLLTTNLSYMEEVLTSILSFPALCWPPPAGMQAPGTKCRQESPLRHTLH